MCMRWAATLGKARGCIASPRSYSPTARRCSTGWAAIDLGCGTRGILDLLAERVAPAGREAGLDADPAHPAMARQFTAQRGLGGVKILAADARRRAVRALRCSPSDKTTDPNRPKPLSG